MNDKFTNIPIEEDTKIIFSSPMRWGELDIVYEKWRWDGITAESMIFLAEDVSTLDDAALKADVRNGSLVKADSQITIKRTDKFTFVNFNFTT